MSLGLASLNDYEIIIRREIRMWYSQLRADPDRRVFEGFHTVAELNAAYDDKLKDVPELAKRMVAEKMLEAL